MKVHFCSPTNQMVGQRREDHQAAGNPAILVPFLPQKSLPLPLFFFSVIFSLFKNHTPDDFGIILVPGSNRTQAKSKLEPEEEVSVLVRLPLPSKEAKPRPRPKNFTQQASSNQEEPFKFNMGGREGIAVAGGHESGHGLFRADISMTEAQEAAAKGYQFSLSSPSTSPTPSPPPPAAAGDGGDATPVPLAWSLGGDKPSEASGNNGVQTAAQTEHANLSSGRRRGRPRGSGRRQILATLGQFAPSNAKRPHFLLQQLENFIFYLFVVSCNVCSPCWFLLHCVLDGVQLGWCLCAFHTQSYKSNIRYLLPQFFCSSHSSFVLLIVNVILMFLSPFSYNFVRAFSLRFFLGWIT